jgi:lipoate-protein ligase A
MLFADNANLTDPRRNLALEEHLLVNGPQEDILLFYVNAPSIIIGRNQNTLDEINLDYVRAADLHVVRRLSGGGAVYHDLGNLNYSFITRGGRIEAHDFKQFTAPVIRALQGMGVPAELSGRNDILVDGRKISGNASYITKAGVVSHGTLLFDSELTHLELALRPKPGKLAGKGIQSVRSRVTNIGEHLPAAAVGLDMAEFRRQLLLALFEVADDAAVPQVALGDADWAAVEALVKTRYGSREWNYGRMETYTHSASARFPFGEVDVRLGVSDDGAGSGKIEVARFYGDFFGRQGVDELEEMLVGQPHTRAALEAALAAVHLDDYFGSPALGSLTLDDLLGLLGV